MALIDEVKLAIGLSDSTYDAEITTFISACKTDLSFGNVDAIADSNAEVKTAIITYCNFMFQLIHGDTDRAERLKAAYDSLKTQMGLSSSFRDWGDLS